MAFFMDIKLLLELKSSTGVITNSSSEIFELTDNENSLEEVKKIVANVVGQPYAVWVRTVDEAIKDDWDYLLDTEMTDDERKVLLKILKRYEGYPETDQVYILSVDNNNQEALDKLFHMLNCKHIS